MISLLRFFNLQGNKHLWICISFVLLFKSISYVISHKDCAPTNYSNRKDNIIEQARREPSHFMGRNVPFYGKKNNCIVTYYKQSHQDKSLSSCKVWAVDNEPSLTKISLKINCNNLEKLNVVYAFQRTYGDKNHGILLIRSSDSSIEFLISEYKFLSTIDLEILNSKLEVFDRFTIQLSRSVLMDGDVSLLISVMKCYRNKGDIFLMGQITNIILGQLQREGNKAIKNEIAINLLNELNKVQIGNRITQIVLSSFISTLSNISATVTYQRTMIRYCKKIFAFPECMDSFFYFMLRVNQYICNHLQSNKSSNFIRIPRDTKRFKRGKTALEKAVIKYKRLDNESMTSANNLEMGTEKFIENELLVAKISCISNGSKPSWTYKKHIMVVLYGKKRLCKYLLISIMQVPETIYENDVDVSIPVYNIKIAYTYFMDEGWERVKNDRIDFRVDRILLPPQTNVSYNVTMPKSGKKWTNELMLKHMAVHRLDCFKDSYIYIRFFLNKGVKLKVLTTISYRPNENDLHDSNIVDSAIEKSLRLVLFDSLEENKWVYLGILPHEDMAKGGNGNFTVAYKLEISSRACMIFDENAYHWKKICTPGEKMTNYLVCVCNHTSFITADVDDVYSRIDIALTMEVALTITNSNCIFYFVASVIFAYCIATCFQIARSSNSTGQEDLFVLADNLKNHRYGYMINIKTANSSDAGTTSNITIQLKGVYNSSIEHVLNYPDPEKRLLDTDTNQSYILVSPSHLGDINEVKLWFDSIGHRPNWSLRKLNVIDLQTKEKLCFSVYRWLDVTKNSHVLILTRENCVDNKMKKTWLTNIHFYFGSQNLWNIFNRSYDVKFPLITRLTIILSQILNTYVVALILYETPKLEVMDGFYMGEINDPIFIVLLGIKTSVISFSFNTGISFIMRHISNKIDENHIFYKENIFPHNTRKYAWALLITNINLSLIFLVFYGFWVPQVKAYMWMITTTVAICINIFVNESIFLSTWNILLFILHRNNKLIFPKVYNFDLILQCIESQRAYIHTKFGEYMLRPYLRHLYAPLDHSRLQAKKLMELKKTEVAQLFKDLIFFVMYVFVLYLFAFMNTNKFLYRSNHEIEKYITIGENNTNRQLKKIEHYNHIYDYIQETFLPKVHANVWYGNWVAKENLDEGLMSDFKSKLLGVVLIRQFRRQKPDCVLPNLMKYLGTPCLLQGIISTEHNHSNRKAHLSGPMWELVTPEQSNLPSIKGNLLIYPKGGFYVLLGRTLEKSMLILRRLRKQKWIDIETKALIFHFWSYNPNVNLFNFVQILIEQSSTGYIIAQYQITSTPLIFVSNYQQTILIVFLILLAILIVNRFVMGINELVTDKYKFLKNIWNYVDVILIACTTIMIAEQLFVQNKTSEVLEKLNNAQVDEFVNFMVITDYLTFGNILRAFTVCLATIRLWKSLRFGITFRIMENTLSSSGGPLLISFFYVFYMMFAFSSLTYTAFGMFDDDIHSMIESYIYLIVKSFGNNKMDAKRKSIRFSNAVFGCTMIQIFLLVTVILYTIITVIIIIHYEQSKEMFEHIHAVYTVKKYVTSEFNYYKALIFRRARKLRMRGGGERTSCRLETVYPKGDTRYSKSVVMQKVIMDRMIIIARLFIRRQNRIGDRLTKADYLLMADAILKYTNAEDYKFQQVIFFQTKSDQRNIVLVSDERLLQMESFVRYILIHTRAAYEAENGLNSTILDVRRENKIKAIGDLHRFDAINNRLIVLTKCIQQIEFVSSERDTY